MPRRAPDAPKPGAGKIDLSKIDDAMLDRARERPEPRDTEAYMAHKARPRRVFMGEGDEN